MGVRARRWLTVLAAAGILTTAFALAMLPRPAPRPAAAATVASHQWLAAEPDWRPTRPTREPIVIAAVTPSPAAVATLRPSPSAAPRAPSVAMRPIPVPAIDAAEVALYDLTSGRYLWQANARAAWAPASLTKIFTAMVAVDLMRLDTQVTVPASIKALPWDSTVMGLTPGERVSVRDLLYGVFLLSGNDAAETLASTGIARPAFIGRMNAKAAALGLGGTHFMNPTGLDAAGHYSTAHDMAVAAIYLEAHYPQLAAMASVRSIRIAATPTHKAFAMNNLDRMLLTYPGADGLKTGWTEVAKGCLITTATRSGHRLLAVVLGAPAVYHAMPSVLDYGFEVIGVLPRPVAP